MRQVLRAAAIALVAISLGACSTIQAINGLSISQNQVDAARNTYDGTILVPLAKYASMPRCAPGTKMTIALPCHDKALLKKLRDADRAVAKAIDDTQDMVTSGNNTGAVAAFKTLQTAITAAQGLVAASGVTSL